MIVSKDVYCCKCSLDNTIYYFINYYLVILALVMKWLLYTSIGLIFFPMNVALKS